MDLIKMARELGKAIQESEEYKVLEQAKALNDKDRELQEMIQSFNMTRVQISTAMQTEEPDEAKIKEYNEELKDKYTKIMANPNMLAFNAAKQEMDYIMNGISTILMAAVNGEDPETCDEHPASCGGSCSTCGGCH